MEDLDLAVYAQELSPGGALVLYTDGIVEDLRDVILGERALLEALKAWARGGFTTRAADLQAGLRIGSHSDDAAMFILKFPHLDEFKTRLPATAHNAQRLRLAARRFVAGCPFEGEHAQDAVLAVGEAVNNAIEHPYAGAEGFVTLSLKRETRKFVAEVRDEGKWQERRSIDRGRGLEIIQGLTDRVDIRKSPNGTTVCFELAYDPAGQPVLVSPG